MAASAPLNAAVASFRKPEPVILTTVLPAAPLVGLRPVTAGRTWKASDGVDPPALVTVIGPVIAVVGTVAVSLVAETILKLAAAAAPPKVTDLVPVNVFPVSVTTVPAEPLVVDSGSIVGRTPRVSPALVPPGVVTVSGPVSAESGSAPVVICVADTPVIEIGSDPSFSVVAPSRFVPVRMSVFPT